MKKLIVALMMAAVVGIASADLGVLFQATGNVIMQDGFTYPPSGGGQTLASGSLVQLVWKADNTGYQSDNLVLSLVNSGEHILSTGFAGANGGYAFGNVIGADVDVGSVDINTGYFYVRIFDGAAPVEGSYFLEMGINGPALAEYNSSLPSTIYSDFANGVHDTISQQGTQVIPEPATAALMGIAGLGMFLARKKVRR